MFCDSNCRDCTMCTTYRRKHKGEKQFVSLTINLNNFSYIEIWAFFFCHLHSYLQMAKDHFKMFDCHVTLKVFGERNLFYYTPLKYQGYQHIINTKSNLRTDTTYGLLPYIFLISFPSFELIVICSPPSFNILLNMFISLFDQIVYSVS